MALAVLAMYFLTLLAPLHQAAASQYDFAELGYATSASWTICSSLTSEQTEDGSTAPSPCSVLGLAKAQLDDAVRDLPVIHHAAVLALHMWPMVEASTFAPPSLLQADPRAPPATFQIVGA